MTDPAPETGCCPRSETARRPRSETVRRSLRALVEGTAPEQGPDAGTTPTPSVDPPRPESVVRDAEDAAADAAVAAAFLSTGRLPELDATIAEAATRGGDIVERGRAARKSLRHLDAALDRPSG